jgi:16S rRNA (adenine(1408)-N(1))-methyltransferase
VTVDLGAGDGRFVLAHAAAHPDRLVVGIDAILDAMRDASRRAARSTARGGLPNARFVVSSIEALPAGLDGFADLVTVHFPWGSLRHAAAGHDPALTARLANLVRPGGHLRLILSSAPRDGGPDIEPDDVAAAYAAHELLVRAVRPATIDDAIAAHSSWGKRLLRRPAPSRRAWAFDLDRPPSARVGTARIEP